MTFTYTEDLSNDSDFVRFHTGDTVSAQAFLSDELITSLIAEHGPEGAVIEGLLYIIQRLSQPDFVAGDFRVDYAQAVRSKQLLLAEKRRTFGLPALRGTSDTTRRGD